MSTNATKRQVTGQRGDAGREMIAAVLQRPRRFEFQQVPRPAPGPAQVRVRLEGCGVCASNVPPWEGRPWFDYPFDPGAPGHEGWGVVDAVGERVTDVKIGQRVTLLSTCAYAEYDVAEASQVVSTPASLEDAPVPGEPLGCAVNVMRRAAIEPGQTVAILGVGFFGALLTRMCVQAGARVIAMARREASLATAQQQGAAHTLVMDDQAQPAQQVGAWTKGQMCDCVIEATGQQAPLDIAAELLRVRGRLVIAGYHQDGLRHVNMQQWNWRGLDVINAHERDPAEYVQGIQHAMELMRNGEVDPSPLFTTRVPLEALNEAMRMAADRPEGFVKALVDVRDERAKAASRERVSHEATDDH